MFIREISWLRSFVLVGRLPRLTFKFKSPGQKKFFLGKSPYFHINVNILANARLVTLLQQLLDLVEGRVRPLHIISHCDACRGRCRNAAR